VLEPAERANYRVTGVDAQAEYGRVAYGAAMLMFSLTCALSRGHSPRPETCCR
jgi:hypothetical protein